MKLKDIFTEATDAEITTAALKAVVRSEDESEEMKSQAWELLEKYDPEEAKNLHYSIRQLEQVSKYMENE
jgi:hypothetical protein